MLLHNRRLIDAILLQHELMVIYEHIICTLKAAQVNQNTASCILFHVQLNKLTNIVTTLCMDDNCLVPTWLLRQPIVNFIIRTNHLHTVTFLHPNDRWMKQKFFFFELR